MLIPDALDHYTPILTLAKDGVWIAEALMIPRELTQKAIGKTQLEAMIQLCHRLCLKLRETQSILELNREAAAARIEALEA